MGETRLYVAQRVSALILAPLVLAHLGLIVTAVRGGLSAAEILARTHDSPIWAGFYGLFVVAAAVHGSIGLRAVAAETLGWRGRGLVWAILAIGLALLALGLRAVVAVIA
ncbi:MAG: succinate dehydrogenase [Kiloniellaceae bacterium]